MFSMFLQNSFNDLTFNEYGSSILILNLVIYTLILYGFFSLFFFFDLKYIKTLNELKLMGNVESVSTLLVLAFLSIAGIPPLAGFASKFILFIFYFSKTNLLIICLFTIFNLCAMFFYIQNTRYIISPEPRNYFIFKNNSIFLNHGLINLFVLLLLFNVFGIIYINDILVFLESSLTEL